MVAGAGDVLDDPGRAGVRRVLHRGAAAFRAARPAVADAGLGAALANYLPFKWTFSFPIEALIGGLPNSELIGGLLMQLLWIGIWTIVVMIGWRFAVKRFTAVGG